MIKNIQIISGERIKLEKLGLSVFSDRLKKSKWRYIETWNRTNLKIVKNREKQIGKKKRVGI